MAKQNKPARDYCGLQGHDLYHYATFVQYIVL